MQSARCRWPTLMALVLLILVAVPAVAASVVPAHRAAMPVIHRGPSIPGPYPPPLTTPGPGGYPEPLLTVTPSRRYPAPGVTPTPLRIMLPVVIAE